MIAMRVGFHIPFSGSLNKLEERIRISRGNTFQVFARSLRGRNKQGEMVRMQKLSEKRLAEYHQFLEKRNVEPVIVHSPYSYNLTKEITDDVTYIQEDLMFANKMKAKYYVLHVGYYKDLHPFIAIENVKQNLKKVLKSVNWEGEILIKNMSGAGTEMVSTLQEWNELTSFHPKIKGALDLGRLFDNGYDFRGEENAEKVFQEIKNQIGWEKIELVYINDTLRNPGDKKNKFIPLGEGLINYQGYQSILSYEELKDKVWIVENQEVLHYDKTIDYAVSFFER